MRVAERSVDLVQAEIETKRPRGLLRIAWSLPQMGVRAGGRSNHHAAQRSSDRTSDNRVHDRKKSG